MKNALLSVLAPAVFVLPALAQTQPPPVLEIIRESIKEGRGAAHEKVEIDYVHAFRKANPALHYLALEAQSGPGEVWFVEPFASFTAVEKMRKQMETPPLKGELALLDARDGELRSNSRNMYAVYRKDLSYRPERANIGKTRYVMLTSLRVRLGKLDEFMSGSKMYLAAMEKSKSNMPSLAYQVIVGAPDGLFLFFGGMESLSALDEEPAREKAYTEALGPENFAQLSKGMGEVFTSMENSLFAVNPRMSYMPKEVEDVDPAFWRSKPATQKPAADTKSKEKTGQ